MPDLSDIHWLAGLLEGEGCFFMTRTSPCIRLRMTDKDVVTRAAELLGGKVHEEEVRNVEWKTTFRVDICGPNAIVWMVTLLPLLGARRRAKINEILHG